MLMFAAGGGARAEIGSALRISSDVARGTAPLQVRFTLLAETYPSGEIAKVEVDPGDGSAIITAHTGRGWVRPSPRHTYTRPGRFTARLRLTTTDGQQIVTRTRILVRPATPPDPTELLRADPTRGDAPHDVSFSIGGRSLPFTARAARLSFGDGQVQMVTPLSTVTHRYTRPGIYQAVLEIRGNDGNGARSRLLIVVAEEPVLRFTVAPNAGVAPVEVTVRANIPRGDIRRARVTQDGQQILATSEIVGSAEGRRKITLTEPGTYEFRIQAETRNGERLQRRETVVVRRENVAEGVTFYEHEGGVVQIVQQGGAFEGIMRAPTVDQAVAGYDIGTVFVRGAYADRAYSALRPLDYDDPDSPRRRYYEDHAVQTAGGSYLILNGQCPPQWGDYSFNIGFGTAERPTSISGTVVYKDHITRSQRAYRRLRQPMPRPGIIGRLNWVTAMIAAMRATGDYSGRPDECVENDVDDATKPAVFTRITPERAQELAHENLDAIRDFAGTAYDGIHGPPEDDGSPRMVDPLYGDPPSSTDPVFLSSGEFYQTTTDLQAAGPRGLGWRFQRTYRSQSAVRTSLGRGWVHNYQLALVPAADGAWHFRDENGGDTRFAPVAGQAGLFEAADGSRLLVDGDARDIRLPDGTIYGFAPALGHPDRSQLSRLTAPGGAALRFDYDLFGRLTAVTDDAGRKARYDYDGDRGYLVRVTAPDGTAVVLGHDGDGNLTRVARLDPGTGEEYGAVRYGYAGWSEGTPEALRGNLTEIRLPAAADGQEGVVRIDYGADPADIAFDRVTWQQTGPLEERFSYAWREVAGARLFVTTLTAEGRAVEEHAFTASGRHESTSYLLPDQPPVVTRLLYDLGGRPAGRILASGASVAIADGPGPNRETISRIPAPGAPGGAEPLHWVVEREPVFDRIRAVYGPVAGAAPGAEALTDLPRRIRYLDYEEAGDLPALARFGFSGGEAPLGDLNGDGVTDAALGRVVKEVASDAGRVEETLYLWNEDGTLAELVAHDGTRTAFAYDGAGALSEVTATDAAGRTRVLAGYDWDENGLLLGFAEAGGAYLGIERDARGQIVRVLGADGTDRRFAYDDSGRVIAEAGADGGIRAEYRHDAFGNLTARIRHADAETAIEEQYGYDPFGRVLTAADAAGTWERELDLLGRTVRETAPDGTETRFAYDAMGRLIEESGPGWRHAHGYDGHGRLIETRLEDGSRYVFGHDARGRPESRTVYGPGGETVQSLELDRPEGAAPRLAVGLGDGARAYLAAAPPEPAVIGNDPRPLVAVATSRDWLGRPVGFAAADGTEWRGVFDLAGRLTEISRDGIVLMQARFEPGNAAASLRLFGFAERLLERDGLTETLTDGRGAVRVQRRDGHGRLLSETATLAERRVERRIERDAAGRIIAQHAGEVTWERDYLGAAPVADTLRLPGAPARRIERRFDEALRIAERVLPGATRIGFAYPAEDTVEIAVAGQTIVIAYGAGGAIASVRMGEAEILYTHPLLGAPTTGYRVQAGPAGTPALDRAFRIDAGMVAAVTENGAGGAVERDPAGRIVSARMPEAAEPFVYRYGADGARLPSLTDLPWLPTHAGAEHGATLDPDGRVVALEGARFGRDPWGRIETVARDGPVTRYLRDAAGRVVRVSRGDEIAADIVYDGATVAGIYGADGDTVEYVLDPGGLPVARLAGDGLELLALDYGGAPLAAIGADGAVTERIALSPFGQPLNPPPGIGPLLDGMLYDPGAGLYLTPLRAMDPRIGQFLAPEPLGPIASPDPYAYAYSDPLTYRDPSGAQGTGPAPDPDTESSWNYFRHLGDGYERGAERLEEELTPEGRERRDARREAEAEAERNRGGPGGGAGGGAGGGTDGGAGTLPEGAAPSRDGGIVRSDYDEDEARWRRRESAERAARMRAREEAFKRNLRHARRVLPEEVSRLWLAQDERFDDMLESIYDDEPVPWGTPATGPVSGSPGDPHALLRAALRGDQALGGQRGDRLRFIFRDQLATEPPVTPPSAQERQGNPGRPRPPGGISGGFGGGGSAQPASAPDTAPPAPTPAPTERRRPGGLSGGLF